MNIERCLGRVRAERWGPRTVDLDILLYGDQTIDLPQLKIPHPELKNRLFLLSAIEELQHGSRLTSCRDDAGFVLGRDDAERDDSIFAPPANAGAHVDVRSSTPHEH